MSVCYPSTPPVFDLICMISCTGDGFILRRDQMSDVFVQIARNKCMGSKCSISSEPRR